MSNPAVSVIIPTYNRVDLLLEALDSVAAQTFRDYETIVVDDGSSEDVSSALRNHPTRPRLLRQAQRGPAAARNNGIFSAQGDLLAFLDSDDLWLPNKLERFVAAIAARPDIPVFYGPMSPVDAQRHPVPGRTKDCHEGQITQHLFCKSFVHVPTVVCRRDLLVRAGGFNESLPVCEDYELWLRLSVEHSFGLIEEPLALRRLHGNRLSKSDMHRNLTVKSTMLERFYRSGLARGKLDRAVAEARLSRVYQAAARAAFMSGLFSEALIFCRKSAKYNGSGLKLLPISIPARLMLALRSGSRGRNSGVMKDAAPRASSQA
jgi:glycosyltransferase involved in cell wall biosynthesis